MTTIAATPTVILLLASPALFEVVFGARWKEAGEIVRAILPWVFLTLMAGPLSRIFPLVHKNREGTLLNVALTISRIGAVLVGYYLMDGDFGLTVVIFGVVCALGSFIFLLRCINLAGVSFGVITGDMLRQLSWVALISLPVMIPFLLDWRLGVVLGATICFGLHVGYLMKRLREI